MKQVSLEYQKLVVFTEEYSSPDAIMSPEQVILLA